MRSVFSAIRRSLASAAMALASSKHGARRMSRSVARAGIFLSRKLSGALRSSNVIARGPRKRRGEPASRLPSWYPVWVRRFDGSRQTSMKSTVLLGHSLRHRQNRYEHPALGFGTELDATVDQREQGMVLGQAYIGARVPLGAALACDDVAGEHVLAAENLQAEPLTVRVAAVAG